MDSAIVRPGPRLLCFVYTKRLPVNERIEVMPLLANQSSVFYIGFLKTAIEFRYSLTKRCGMDTIHHDKRFRKTDDLEDKAMKMRIVADSSANLLEMKDVEFASVPMHIIVGEQDYADTAEIDLAAYQQHLREYKGKTTTAAPSPGEWEEAFGDADVIFCFTLTGAMSGTHNSAVIAGESYESEHPGAKVYVVDSLSTGPEIYLLAEKTRELILAGMEPEKIYEEIRAYHQTTHLYFSLASVDNFAKNGRVSHVIAKGIGLMGIRIVGTASPEGTLDFKGKCRGDKKALALILEKMKELGYKGGRVVIAHNQNEAAALQLKMRIEELFGYFNGVIHPERALCCYYAEPGSVMVGFEA